MNKLGERIHNYTNDELKVVLEQMNELNKNGYINEEPLRSILDEAGSSALVTASILIYKEAAERWLNNR